MKIVAAFAAPDSEDVGKDIGEISGIGKTGVKVNPPEKIGQILRETKPDVAVDFTNAKACVGNISAIAKHGINVVIGTTGFSENELKELRGIINKNKIGAVISPNMSVGVNMYWKLLEESTGMFKDWDVRMREVHHVHKKDAPSGTALRTADLVAEKLGRRRGSIPIEAIREGEVVGDHSVFYETPEEYVEVKHSARNRDVFVKGTIVAINFIKGKKGIYSMFDVLGL